MRKRVLTRQVGQLVMEHAPDQISVFDHAVTKANAKAARVTALVAAGAVVVAAVASVVAFLATMGGDLAEYGSQTLSDAEFLSVLGLPVPVLVLAVGLGMTNRRAFAHTLGQILVEQGVLDRVPPPLRAQPLQTLYQVTWMVATVVLVVFGAVWAAVISLGTSMALGMAKNPKSM